MLYNCAIAFVSEQPVIEKRDFVEGMLGWMHVWSSRFHADDRDLVLARGAARMLRRAGGPGTKRRR